MLRLIKKSIFVLRTYGPRVFIYKAIKFPIINLLKQNLANKKAYKNNKNKEKVIQLLKLFNSDNPEYNFIEFIKKKIKIRQVLGF